MPMSNKARQKKFRQKQKQELERLRKREQRMNLNVYSIRDAKAEVFNPPFFKKTHGEAERDFTTLVNDEKSTVFNYPEDFDLYYLGVYNDSTGRLAPIDTAQHLVKAIQVKKQQ